MSGGWNAYIDDLMKIEGAQDAAIVGMDPPAVWAAYEHGNLKNIQADQIKALITDDAVNFCMHGVTLGSKKCTVIRDQLTHGGFADLKVKAACEDEKHCIAVAKTQKAFIILEGSSGPSSGGVVNLKAFKLAQYLKDSGF